MNPTLDSLLNVHEHALRLRALRQQVLASNIANADTPDFKARDFDFSAALRRALEARDADAVGAAAAPADPPLLYRRAVQPSLDGNSVDMDLERAQFADNALRYEAEIAFINAHLRTLLAAVQG